MCVWWWRENVKKRKKAARRTWRLTFIGHLIFRFLSSFLVWYIWILLFFKTRILLFCVFLLLIFISFLFDSNAFLKYSRQCCYGLGIPIGRLYVSEWHLETEIKKGNRNWEFRCCEGFMLCLWERILNIVFFLPYIEFYLKFTVFFNVIWSSLSLNIDEW